MSSINDTTNIVEISSILADSAEEEKELSKLEEKIINSEDTEKDTRESFDAEGHFSKEMEKVDALIGSGGDSSKTDDKNDKDDERDDFGSEAEDDNVEEIKFPDKPEPPINDKKLQTMTTEAVQQKKVDSALQDITGADIDDKELKEMADDTEKIDLLDQIDTLREILEEDGEDLSKIPPVNATSPLIDIQTVLRRLRLKNERVRNKSFADNTALVGAMLLEHVFDGNRKIFGKTYDMSDCSDTLKIYLRRMRYETSSLVHQIMDYFGIGPTARNSMEILFAMLLHSRRKRQVKGDNLATSKQYMDAIHDLNTIQENKKN